VGSEQAGGEQQAVAGKEEPEEQAGLGEDDPDQAEIAVSIKSQQVKAHPHSLSASRQIAGARAGRLYLSGCAALPGPRVNQERFTPHSAACCKQPHSAVGSTSDGSSFERNVPKRI
jgi:hypothetical protein